MADEYRIEFEMRSWVEVHDGSEPGLPAGIYLRVEDRANGHVLSRTLYGPIDPEHVELLRDDLARNARFYADYAKKILDERLGIIARNETVQSIGRALGIPPEYFK